ncbi:uncharacterized protein TRAVEDRAFT_114910 [Trametes versicolor FP-101664 SS1]|uniref:uncharacterized protein n=1 Tax=Trametes versicolor (strain FP-101664) TaxID=717944 RepID=UPI0004624460|nr:uncharacterized protein TRAVEDRAFT_114910 [Trametes versicolor FP-101664 SS1]EIW62862.1 hypothetical protein TRAVEDRAFT_114910 [Trametes versicolor FP-101664 SS1]
MLRLSWLVSVFAAGILAQSPPQTFFPASVPLAIRSPYMSIWSATSNVSAPPSDSWPLFWGQHARIDLSHGSQTIMDLQGTVRVDGKTYLWTGQTETTIEAFSANLSAVRITPTRTIFVLQAGPINVTITYLSPIEPSEWVLQSFPFSYVYFEAASLDGRPHTIQVYSELTQLTGDLIEWLSNDWYDSTIRWNQYSTDSVVTHILLENPQKYVEVRMLARDVEAYFAMASRANLTWQIDGNENPRRQFQAEGVLTNTSSTAFATIAPDIVLFGISADLGQIQSTSSPVAWALGVVRNPSIGYTSADKMTQDLSPYYVTRYPGTSMTQAIDDFTARFMELQQRAVALDDAILGSASKISTQYADLVSLAARQTMGSLDFTVSTGADGKPNASDVRIFMKDTSGTTAVGRVNPVEKMYAALPMLIYLNASLVGPLLVPLLDAQDGMLVQPSAAQDLGMIPLQLDACTVADHILESGNMLIMLYAHARFSGDGTLIQRHYSLAKRWTNYLVDNSLDPSSLQVSTDTEAGTPANTTNLALKGIIGVKSMAEMCRALGEDADAQLYDGHAAALAAAWQSLALSSDGSHLLGVYGDQQSWALMYNIYADRLLGTGIVNHSVSCACSPTDFHLLMSTQILQGQTVFYKTLLNSAWILFTAAIVTDDGVRDSLIRGVWNRASFNQTEGPFPDSYDTSTGAVPSSSALTNAS